MVGKVISTQVHMTFSQLQNYVGQIAQDKQLDYHLWAHSDVAVLPSSANSTLLEEIMG